MGSCRSAAETQKRKSGVYISLEDIFIFTYGLYLRVSKLLLVLNPERSQTSISACAQLCKQFTMSSIHGPWPQDRAFWSIAVSHTTTFGFSISSVLCYSCQGAQSQVKKAAWVSISSKVLPSSLSSLSNSQNLHFLSTHPFCHEWWLLAKCGWPDTIMCSIGGNSTVGFWCLTSLSTPSHSGVCWFLFGPCLFTVHASSWVLLLADRTFLHPPISCYLDVCNITNYWHVLQISHIDMFYNNMTYCVFWWWPPKAYDKLKCGCAASQKMFPCFPLNI